MAKKYLNIEEAAALLGVEPVDLTRLREKGEIRAFADRGTWKFRQDDVEELARNRQTDSGADIPMLTTPTAPPPLPKKQPDLSNTIMFDDDDADSAIDLGNEPDQLSEQPTIVRKSHDDLATSDSDVRLVFDDNLLPDVEEESSLADLEHSDSDVRLIAPGKNKPLGDSDSDVKLVPDTANRKTPLGSGTGSDSDVALIGASDDEISLDLDQSGGSFVFGGENSGIALEAGASPSDIRHKEDSGIVVGDSGIALDSGDSGISFDIGDSGIALDDGGDSGISLDVGSGVLLAGDSGISLADPSDSGIALDSGSRKTPAPGQRKKPAAKDDLGGTQPMINIPELGAHDDLGATQMEVPLLTEQDSDYELTSTMAEIPVSGGVLLDDEDDVPAPRAGRRKAVEVDDGDETSEFTAEAFDDDDDMVVSEDVVGEDDEIDDDVFDAGDDDFDEELQSGQSHADFALPTSARASAPVEVEWGGGTFFMLSVASAVMLVTSFMMYELVRTMWGGNEPSQGTETILASLRGMFG